MPFLGLNDSPLNAGEVADIGVNSEFYLQAIKHARRHGAVFAEKGNVTFFELLFLVCCPFCTRYIIKADRASIRCFVIGAHLPQRKERIDLSFLPIVYCGYGACDDLRSEFLKGIFNALHIAALGAPVPDTLCTKDGVIRLGLS